jgi:glutamyl-tRNA synthetase
MSLRVRFAPSPTGYLHVGGARTALFNWLLARARGGSFVLRIEDTDRERSDESHTQAILHGLGWLGLDWDEGPYFQSDGLDRHREDALRLLAEGKAYRDFTTPEALRVEAQRRGLDNVSPIAREKADELGHDEAERRAADGQPHAVRFRVPEGETRWEDLVHGEMRFGNADLEDLVILRSDGSPTYNLAVVSDDSEQRVTHVLRGDDHISNTPKQILLYQALDRPVPVFGHMPLILGPDGKRLSKRHGATAVGEYEAAGILSGAMFNFLSLLGWNPGDEREVMDREELVQAFSIDRVQKKSAVFDLEKLHWLNGQHLARTPTETLLPLVRAQLASERIDPHRTEGDAAWFGRVVDLLKVRARTVTDIARQSRPYLVDALDFDEAAVAKHWAREPEETLLRLEALWKRLAAAAWEEAALEASLRTLAEELGVGAGKLIHPLRVALTGQAASPGIFEVLVLLGKERALARVSDAVERVRARIGEISRGAAPGFRKP